MTAGGVDCLNRSPMFSRDAPPGPICLVDRMLEPPHHGVLLSEVPS
jgi:hypothetical protein